MDERLLTTCEICTSTIDVTGETPGVIVSCTSCGGPVIVPEPPRVYADHDEAAEAPETEREHRPVSRGALFSSMLGRVVDEAHRRLPK